MHEYHYLKMDMAVLVVKKIFAMPGVRANWAGSLEPRFPFARHAW